MAKFDSILETVGRTPVVRINKLAPPHVELFAKLEAFNPLGSVKDRLALGVIEDAERRGALKPGQTVIEATSGNTGIGLAMVCASKGYPLVIVMAESFSIERRKLMRFLGAKVVLTPAWAKGTGMVSKALELSQAHGWFLCRQFENEANAEVHSRTTAREILADFEGERLDYFVTGAGTGGTLKGVARVLRAQRPDTTIVLAEPDNSPMLGSGINQPRASDGTPSQSHPLYTPHLIQGWTPDFIPKLTEEALALGLVDRVVPVDTGEAMRLSRELARKEGIFTGTSGGATFAAALQVCASARAGARVLCILPDTGERYLSTPLFEGIAENMTEEEIQISNSTPSVRWGAAPPSAAAPTPASPDAASDELARSLLEDPERKVVVVAFQWCEYTWAARKLFAHCAIPYTAIELDSPELQANGRGAAIRAAISARTGSPTIPQIFVCGQFVGGAFEVLDAYAEGRLQTMLTEAGVPFDATVEIDAHSLLPNWCAKP